MEVENNGRKKSWLEARWAVTRWMEKSFYEKRPERRRNCESLLELGTIWLFTHANSGSNWFARLYRTPNKHLPSSFILNEKKNNKINARLDINNGKTIAVYPIFELRSFKVVLQLEAPIQQHVKPE